MNECEKARNELLQWEAFISLAGFMLSNTDGLPCDGEGIYQNSVKHVQTCEKCRSWVESKIPNDEKARLERINKYCCPVM
ncbi:hypothetical protein [Teredinibacter turnerae]|uniref:hypothetical protein n=1 Tax=Teredinibacter turnerae TaxID=2426 RepID=UPI0030CC9CDB